MAGMLTYMYFTEDDLWAIKAKIVEAELKTSGEIRVKIRERCQKEFEGAARLQAFADFCAEGLSKTRDKTGVLILLLLEERKLEILADEGINSELPPGELDVVAAQIVGFFRRGTFKDGLIHAVEVLGEHLARHFPRKPDDRNELPDDVIAED